MTIRQPAVAGTFYPQDPVTLSTEVDNFLKNASVSDPGVRPNMLIVPHAGYIYSGAFAANAYERLRPFAHSWQRVLLLGPSHRVAVRGIALSTAQQFLTPLGSISLAQNALQPLSDQPWVEPNDRAHRDEHSLEVQLPFLQRVLGDFELIPLVVGSATSEQVCETIERLYDNTTLVVISTDLSHFQSDHHARQTDARTCEKILNFRTSLSGEEACGHNPLNGALLFAHRQGWSIDLVAQGNSGKVSGDLDRVVGYAAFTLTDARAA